MSETNRTETLLKFTRSRRARFATLSVALGVTASLAAAPRVHEARIQELLIQDAEVAPASKPAPSATPAKRRWFEIGKASWYGGQFNGRKTANGETFDMNTLTAAHRTLPLGSWIRVTNLHNNRSVLVKVNDRGPMVENVVLDLSYAAAQRLGFNGTAQVRIEPLVKTPSTTVRKPQTQYLAELQPPPQLHHLPFGL